jgi:enoyl-CoA hydratase/carnithine racemase
MQIIQASCFGATVVATMKQAQHRNALVPTVPDEFSFTVEMVIDGPETRAVALTGASGHFCAGGHFKGMAPNAALPKDVLRAPRSLHNAYRWFDELVDLEKPVIAAVDGVALGAGRAAGGFAPGGTFWKCAGGSHWYC